MNDPSKRNVLQNVRDVLAGMLGIKPDEVNGVFNRSSGYWTDWMIERVFSRFEIEGAPDWWDIDYVKEGIFLDGQLCITSVEGYGAIPLKGQATGINVFNKYTDMICPNYIIGTVERIIDVNCTVVHINHTWTGMVDLFAHHAYNLASCDAGIDVNLMNCKIPYMFPVSSDKEAREVQAVCDRVNTGVPYITYNTKIPMEPYTFPVKQNFIADSLFELREKFKNDFLADIGVKSANTEKKERLIKDEVKSENTGTMFSVDGMLKRIRKSFDWANRMYGLNLRLVVKQSDEEKEVGKDEPGKGNNASGNGDVGQ